MSMHYLGAIARICNALYRCIIALYTDAIDNQVLIVYGYRYDNALYWCIGVNLALLLYKNNIGGRGWL